MAQKDHPTKPQTEQLTPWVIGVLGLVLFAFATYLNYGSELHWGSTDVSATSQGANSEK
jgi:hypothetical protein